MTHGCVIKHALMAIEFCWVISRSENSSTRFVDGSRPEYVVPERFDDYWRVIYPSTGAIDVFRR